MRSSAVRCTHEDVSPPIENARICRGQRARKVRHFAACDVSFPLRGRLRRTSPLCRDGRVSLFGEGSSTGHHLLGTVISGRRPKASHRNLRFDASIRIWSITPLRIDGYAARGSLGGRSCFASLRAARSPSPFELPEVHRERSPLVAIAPIRLVLRPQGAVGSRQHLRLACLPGCGQISMTLAVGSRRHSHTNYSPWDGWSDPNTRPGMT